MHVIETKKLTYVYPDGTKALDEVNFKARKNEITALVGANGAGKTTMLKHFNGLLRPTSGKVLVKGKEITKKNLMNIRKTVGLVFQNPDDQLFAPTVAQDVAFGPMNLGLAEDEVEDRVKKSLDFVGMSGLEEKPPHHLSYGEKKRVAIAGVLAMQPSIMVLDEPTLGLDPIGTIKIINLLKKLKSLGMSTIVATHDVDIVPIFADMVYLLSKGKMKMKGSPEEVFNEMNDLRLPYIGLLLRALKKEGLELDVKLTVEEAKEEILKLWK